MNAERLLNEMTIKEKVGQLNQRLYGWQTFEKTAEGIQLTQLFKDEVARWGGIGVLYGAFRSDPWSGKDLDTGLTTADARQFVTLANNYISTHTRLKIPMLLAEEAPHGHQALEATSMPANITAGQTWNPELLEQTQGLVAQELRQKGAHLGLVSTLDIIRDPRWGRSEEGFSEDPYLASVYTEATVKGFQGHATEPLTNEHVFAVLKHFAAQGDGMGGHNAAPASIGQRELWEIHLPAMAAGIKAGAKLCMAAYNEIDGILCHANQQLLTTILRDTLHFKGAVMSDGCALDGLVRLTGSPTKAAALALTSGVDISLWDNVFPYLEEAIAEGELSEAALDVAVLRVLKLKEELGLLRDAPLLYSTDAIDQKQRHELPLKLAEEGAVLLKNNHSLLPLNVKELSSIAVIGPNADKLYNQLGDYTPYKDDSHCVTVLNGIETALTGTDIALGYEQGSEITSPIEQGIQRALALATRSDVIVMVIGGSSARDFNTEFDANGAALSGSDQMNCGENIDLSQLDLPSAQIALIEALGQLNKPMIAVLIQGRQHSIQPIQHHFKSILACGYPGEKGGTAIANLLFGKSVPSGKLATSIPTSSGQLPVYYNYKDSHHKETYFDDNGKASFPFGFGLSYSSFELSPATLNRQVLSLTEINKEHPIVVELTIKNTGEYHAAEVIQVYFKRKNMLLVPRVKELKAFQKIWLAPGEERTVQMTIPESSWPIFSLNNRLELVPHLIDLSIEATDYQCLLPFELTE